jgi:hypothetical protein
MPNAAVVVTLILTIGTAAIVVWWVVSMVRELKRQREEWLNAPIVIHYPRPTPSQIAEREWAKKYAHAHNTERQSVKNRR